MEREMMDEKINCLKLIKKESIIKHIFQKMYTVNWVTEKAVLAEALYEEVNRLLSCPDHKRENLNCQNCHYTAGLYKNKARIVISENLYEESKMLLSYWENKEINLPYENMQSRATLYRRLEKLIIKLKS